jgi:hypothetical protein
VAGRASPPSTPQGGLRLLCSRWRASLAHRASMPRTHHRRRHRGRRLLSRMPDHKDKAGADGLSTSRRSPTATGTHRQHRSA